ncbi:hypothetical protein [Phaffia rhodozyma]|uniref:Uncharacterized protein n=1 Tax=Phaffia rhodozyma TaxID=264483 RepID=A0A0F7SEC7_PHARH|nr:hypothetical protein [Phaffia rhodozyma]
MRFLSLRLLVRSRCDMFLLGCRMRCFVQGLLYRLSSRPHASDHLLRHLLAYLPYQSSISVVMVYNPLTRVTESTKKKKEKTITRKPSLT